MITQEEVMQFFCRAMFAGFAGGNEPTPDTTQPGSGWMYHQYYEGTLALRDQWLTGPGSDFSSGVTTIYEASVPVWCMAYQGWYKPSAIVMLKAALRQNYEQGIFLGGRGPWVFNRDALVYYNNPTGNLSDFSGMESIWNCTTQEMLGKHWYRGFWF
ncbi:hypothetical protein C4564_01315 [Candidatus Microgenomates bacterium]|nr:MAG: hypothetical protein C4564_01315 [Candidatus Microgenomates bacterium]